MEALTAALDRACVSEHALYNDLRLALGDAHACAADGAREPAQARLVQHMEQLVTHGGGEFAVIFTQPIQGDTEGARARMHETRIEVDLPWVSHTRGVDAVAEAAAAAGAVGTEMCRDAVAERTVLLLRRASHSVKDHIEVRIATVGNVDAGKSTLLGVLTKGVLDDGRGRARVDLFRHKHEAETGRTSSVGTEVMGFFADGRSVVDIHAAHGTAPARKPVWEHVCRSTAKVVSFIDLAGHERYLKTTVFGMTSYLPDYVILMVGANAGLIGMSKEHLGIALALGVPVAVVVTKVDMCPPHVLDATMAQIAKVLQSPGCRKMPIKIESMAQAADAALQLPLRRICPIFEVSNVTGHHLDLLRCLVNLLPSSQARYAPLQDAPVEMPISDVFSVPFVGTVVSGVLTSGVVSTGDALLLGPDGLGQFHPTAVRSIQRKRMNVESASAGQSISCALKRVRRHQVRKGMLLLARTTEAPSVHQEFEAETLCLYHATTLSIGSCIVLHASNVRQTVKIMAIASMEGSRSAPRAHPRKPPLASYAADDAKPVVRMGDRARLRLRFTSMPEFIQPGTKIIAREGKTKLVGVVRSVGAEGLLASRTTGIDCGGERNTGMERATDGPGSADPALHMPRGHQLSGTA
ncbi:hypothetical protein MSPP1_000164 [Malassezia sp. CBS 17886]|nr:hypothetical protein MSPP1_000164 [Malassezia sp. CBS 17886]